MKYRNAWKKKAWCNKQWDKFHIRLRLGKVDVIAIELDISRKFYLFTLINFTIKTR
jgi:hypothetical protein